MSLSLTGSFLLVGHGSAARSLTGTGVSVGALSAYRQPAAMPQPAIRSHFDETLDVHRKLLAEIAFDGPFVLNQGSNAVDFVFAHVGDLLAWIHVGTMEQRERTGAPDTVDICQTDLGPLLSW